MLRLLSVVIPAYNEEEILGATLRELDAALSRQAEEGHFADYEILAVSDGSSDSTFSIAQTAEKELCHVRAIGYPENHGKGYAVRCGALQAKGDAVLYTDSDLAYGTDVIGEMCDRMTSSGADIVIGSRAIHPKGYEGYTFLRRFASKAYLRILSLLAGFSLSDSQCGLKMFSSGAVTVCFAPLVTERFAFDFELLLRAQDARLAIAELPVRVLRHGESKVHLVRDSLRMLRDLSRIRKTLRKERRQKNGIRSTQHTKE